MLECRNLSKRFYPGFGVPVLQVFSDVSFSLRQGESLAILGPSGSGKSTLLNIIGLLDFPSSGELLWDGKSIVALPPAEQSRFLSRAVGFVFQLHHLLPQCTARENVIVPTLSAASFCKGKVAAEKADFLLEKLGLKDRSHFKPWQLSGGECQRVALARALIQSPRLLLADEPTGSLDMRTSESLVEALMELNKKEKMSLLIVTHAEWLAKRLDRMMYLENGTLRREK